MHDTERTTQADRKNQQVVRQVCWGKAMMTVAAKWGDFEIM